MCILSKVSFSINRFENTSLEEMFGLVQQRPLEHRVAPQAFGSPFRLDSKTYLKICTRGTISDSPGQPQGTPFWWPWKTYMYLKNAPEASFGADLVARWSQPIFDLKICTRGPISSSFRSWRCFRRSWPRRTAR